MARKYTGPKREDGEFLGENTASEYRGYLVDDTCEVWSFMAQRLRGVTGQADDRGEHLLTMGPTVFAGIRKWFRQLDADGK